MKNERNTNKIIKRIFLNPFVFIEVFLSLLKTPCFHNGSGNITAFPVKQEKNFLFFTSFNLKNAFYVCKFNKTTIWKKPAFMILSRQCNSNV